MVSPRRTSGQPQTRRRTSPTRSGTTRTNRPTRPVSRKSPTGLIIGGSVAGVSILILILIFSMGGEEKKRVKKKDTVPPPTTTRKTGDEVDEARLHRGIVKCEKGYDMYRALKSRMHTREGLSNSGLQALQRDIEASDHKIQEGLADIEYSNGRASVTHYQKAHKDMKMVLMELK